jgi:hypothetical protein
MMAAAAAGPRAHADAAARVSPTTSERVAGSGQSSANADKPGLDYSLTPARR